MPARVWQVRNLSNLAAEQFRLSKRRSQLPKRRFYFHSKHKDVHTPTPSIHLHLLYTYTYYTPTPSIHLHWKWRFPCAETGSCMLLYFYTPPNVTFRIKYVLRGFNCGWCGCTPDWGNLHPLLASLGIMRDQLRESLKPINMTVLWWWWCTIEPT